MFPVFLRTRCCVLLKQMQQAPHQRMRLTHFLVLRILTFFNYFIYSLLSALWAGILKFCEQLYLGTVFLLWFLWQSPWQKRLEGGVCFGSEFESTFHHGGRGLRHQVTLQWGSRKTSDKVRLASSFLFCLGAQPVGWCCPHLGWVLPLQWTQVENSLTDFWGDSKTVKLTRFTTTVSFLWNGSYF